MKNLLLIALITIVLASCNQATNTKNTMKEQEKQTEKSISPQDTTPKVTGIGGIFFYSDDPDKTKEWYTKNLGVEINDWGSRITSYNVCYTKLLRQ